MFIHPRIRWLLKTVSGADILNLGFVGKADLLHARIREINSRSFVVGLDLNGESVLKLKVANSVIGNALDLPFKDKSFSSVVLGEVIEHTYEGYKLLSEMNRVLRTDGKLYLTTPNAYAPLRWVRFWLLSRQVNSRNAFRKYLADPDHKMFWEPGSLFNLLNDSNLEIVEFTSMGHRVPYIARYLKRFTALDIKCYPFNRFGGNLCIIAKKRPQS